jgi:hypothetical protein
MEHVNVLCIETTNIFESLHEIYKMSNQVKAVKQFKKYFFYKLSLRIVMRTQNHLTQRVLEKSLDPTT